MLVEDSFWGLDHLPVTDRESGKGAIGADQRHWRADGRRNRKAP